MNTEESELSGKLKSLRRDIRTIAKALLQVDSALYPTEQMDVYNKDKVRKIAR